MNPNMPCIQTKVNVGISPEKEETLKKELGNAIALIPGKSDSWLMLTFEDNCRIAFQGNSQEPAAFVEVKIFGKAPDSAYEALTAEITKILGRELGVGAKRIYVKYEEVQHWGWNGGNF